MERIDPYLIDAIATGWLATDDFPRARDDVAFAEHVIAADSEHAGPAF
jgi:hypothetical protein